MNSNPGLPRTSRRKLPPFTPTDELRAHDTAVRRLRVLRNITVALFAAMAAYLVIMGV